MQKRVVLVSAVAAALGVAAAVLGFMSERANSKAFVTYDRDAQRCVYRRTAAFWGGIAAAALALAGVSLITAASGFFGRYYGGAGYRRSTASSWLPVIAWVVVLVAAMLFLYGASRNAGGTSGLTRSRGGRRFNRTYYYYCALLRGGVFATASVASGVATACAIAAYLNLHAAEAEPAGHQGQFAQQGVAMGPPQWSHHQPYPPAQPSQFAPQWQPAPYPPDYPPVAYPAAPHHGYGDGYAGK